MSNLDGLIQQWNAATTALPWGVQRTFYETLQAARDGDITLQYGADYGSDGQPCLVNSVANMLGALDGVGGTGKPSRHFRDVVSLFDRINYSVADKLGDSEGRGTVSHYAADIMVRHFGQLKTVEEATADAQATEHLPEVADPYTEKSDTELMNEWVASLSQEPAAEAEVPADDNANVADPQTATPQ